MAGEVLCFLKSITVQKNESYLLIKCINDKGSRIKKESYILTRENRTIGLIKVKKKM